MIARCRVFVPTAVTAMVLALPPGQASALEHVEVAEGGDLVATFEYEDTTNEYGGETESALTLAISRAGSIVYSAPVTSEHCVESCASAYEAPDVHVATLEPGHPPVVVLEVTTDGAHCCYISQVFSGPGTSGITMLEHEFGDPRGRLDPIGQEGSDVFVSADDRFAYAFTDYADSGLPLQIWALQDGVFSAVTAATRR